MMQLLKSAAVLGISFTVMDNNNLKSSLDLVSDSLTLGVRTPKHVLLRLFTLVAQVATLGTGWIIPVDPVVGGQSPVEELDNVNPVGESFPGAQCMSQWPPVNGIDQVSTDLLLFNHKVSHCRRSIGPVVHLIKLVHNGFPIQLEHGPIAGGEGQWLNPWRWLVPVEELCISSGLLKRGGVSVCNADSDEGLVLEEGVELGPQVIVVKRSIVLGGKVVYALVGHTEVHSLVVSLVSISVQESKAVKEKSCIEDSNKVIIIII